MIPVSKGLVYYNGIHILVWFLENHVCKPEYNKQQEEPAAKRVIITRMFNHRSYLWHFVKLTLEVVEVVAELLVELPVRLEPEQAAELHADMQLTRSG